jgi:hypothetical protein
VLVSFLKGFGVAEEDAMRIVSKITPGPYNQLSKTEITNLLLSLVGRGIDDRHPITYVSVPVTTGRAYLDWLIRHLDDSYHSTEQVWAVKQEVSETNRRRARDVIKRLRTRLPGMVIDPSSLVDIDDWRQSDYHSFWLKVIARYADRLILVDGWQYSVGCTIEFAESVKLGLPTFTENCEQLEVGSGIRLVRAALQEYAAARVDPAPLRRALEAAEKAAAA